MQGLSEETERRGYTKPRTSGFGDRSGFTIVELVVIMILIGLMASIAAPSFNRWSFEIESEAAQALTTIMGARHMAVLKQHDVVLAFDTANQRVRIHTDVNSNGTVDSGEDTRLFELSESMGFGRGGAPAWGDYTRTLNMTQKQDGFPSITFHRNGSASEETRFYLTTQRAVQNGGFPEDARAFDVQRATGRIECRSYSPTDGEWSMAC